MINKRENMVKKILFIIIPIILTISHLTRKFQLWNRSQQEIKNLQTQISQLRHKKTDLEKKKEYYQSDEFIKKEARENLGLIKPNEKVLVLPSITEVKGDQDENQNISSLPPYKQWYKLFFE
jgi:cell division protein FtsB